MWSAVKRKKIQEMHLVAHMFRSAKASIVDLLMGTAGSSRVSEIRQPERVLQCDASLMSCASLSKEEISLMAGYDNHLKAGRHDLGSVLRNARLRFVYKTQTTHPLKSSLTETKVSQHKPSALP
jgi:hypothetical protein